MSVWRAGHGSDQPGVEDLTPSSGLCKHCMQAEHLHTCVFICRQNIPIHIYLKQSGLLDRLRVVLGPGELYVNRNETCTMSHYTILARVVCVPLSREALTI